MASRILLIEHNPTDAQVIEQLIQVKEGINPPDMAVIRVENLAGGLERLSEQDFDAVLCDLDLPDAGDLEGFFRALVSAGKAVVALADDMAEVGDLGQYGVSDLLYKGSMEHKLLRRSLMFAIAQTREAAARRANTAAQFIPGLDVSESESARRNRVLLITDNLEDNQLGAQIEDLGYVTSVASTPEDALEKTRGYLPAVIIIESLDTNEKAVERVRALKERQEFVTLPVIIASRSFNTEEILKAQAAGIDSFITRPIRMGELAIMLGNMTRLRGRETQLYELTDTWQQARVALSSYFPGDFIEHLTKQKLATEIDGAMLQASLLFFGLRDVRAGLDTGNPALLGRLLNSLFGDVMNTIVDAGGSINRLDGDSLLASFGCPTPREGDPANALKAAGKIKELMQARSATDGQNALEFGLALTTGQVFAATLGSDHRRQYSLLGDPIDRGKSLLAMALKSARTNMLGDAATKNAAGEAAAGFKRVRTKNENAPEMYLIG